jgi:hypothetical protein
MILVYGSRKRTHCLALIAVLLGLPIFIIYFVDWSVLRTWINFGSVVPTQFITKSTHEIKAPLQYNNDTSNSLSGVDNNTYITKQTKSINDRLYDDIIAKSSCIWKTDDIQHCFDILIHHISISLNRTRMEFLESQQRTAANRYYNNLQQYFHNRSTIIHRRWLFMGDSTIFRLFVLTPINTFLIKDSLYTYQQYRTSIQIQCPNNIMHDQLSCNEIYCSRCNTMEQLHLQRLTQSTSNIEWKKPNFWNGEGPLKYGLDNPYCSDCDGCDTRFVSCSILFPSDEQDTTATECIFDPNPQELEQQYQYIGPSYGGYLSVEFARDVELQTLEYNTTQENLLSSYIGKHWNTPLEQQITEFGYPICVVGTGHHDVAIPKITKDIYLQNVQWYVQILSQQCDYIIWISNNCPLTDDFAQTKNGTLEWNLGVRDLFLSSKMKESIRSKVFFLDVFDASTTFEHNDNIHMSNSWYELLASFLQTVMTSLTL